MDFMRFLRRSAVLLSLSLIWPNLVSAQLLLDVDVDVTQDSEGIYTYLYTLENSDFSTQSVNTFFLSTGAGADVSLIEGPSDDWIGFYERDASPSNLQAAWMTGLNAAGDVCGVTDQFDLFPGQSATFKLVSSWQPGIKDAFIGRTGSDCFFVGNTFTADLQVPLTPPVTLTRPCDFDEDGDCDVTDIDNLNATIIAGLNDVTYDLTADTAVNRADLELFLIQVERLSGDLDLSGAVDFADFLVLSSNFGLEADWSGGDIDSDGTVAFGDFLVLSSNFGEVFSASAVSAAAVPEPAAGVLFVLALLSMMSQRRRR